MSGCFFKGKSGEGTRDSVSPTLEERSGGQVCSGVVLYRHRKEARMRVKANEVMWDMSREEREEFVAEVLEQHVNYGGVPVYALADRISRWHRHLQGELFCIVRAIVRMWAGKHDKGDFDARNESAVKLSSAALPALDGCVDKDKPKRGRVYLKTRVEVLSPDTEKTYHRVYLDCDDDDGEVILSIEDTRGNWYLSTLLGVDGLAMTRRRVGEIKDTIWVDAGAECMARNMKEAIIEAVSRCKVSFTIKEE